MKTPIRSINIGERFRQKFDDMDSLKDSIKKHGLIEPIVLDENHGLIAGERRLKCCTQLGWNEIDSVYMKDLDDYQKREIELEENIQRKQFTWQEEVSAKEQIHKLKQSIHGKATQGHADGGWGLKDTAVALGQTPGNISMDITLAAGLKAFPELLKEKNKTTAYKKLKDLQMNIINKELAKRMKDHGLLDHPNVTLGNCIDIMKEMDAESIDLILSDPPFGIDVGEAHTFNRMTMVTVNYNDGEFETMDMLDQAFTEMFRILKINRNMAIFCAVDKFPFLSNSLIKKGFMVHHLPIIWDKGSGSYPSQKTTFVHSYECIIHASKGNRKLNGTPRDILQYKRVPPTKKIHPSEKPTQMLRDLIELLSFPGEKVLDPFAGSGATIEAARQTARMGIGIELNKEYFSKIVERLGVVDEGT